MLKTVTTKQIKELDRVAIEKIGIPSLVLMENAGRSVANAVSKAVHRIDKPKVVIVCGLGNNAGDGFVVARHLLNRNINTKIYLIGVSKKLKQDALVNYSILKKLKYPVCEIGRTTKTFLTDLKKADMVVDAIFGVGLNREVGEPFRSAIESINESKSKVMAVDVPSGLDATTGQIYGVCVKAKSTITFSFAKTGFFKAQGPKHAEKVIIADIGIPEKIKRLIIKKQGSKEA